MQSINVYPKNLLTEVIAHPEKGEFKIVCVKQVTGTTNVFVGIYSSLIHGLAFRVVFNWDEVVTKNFLDEEKAMKFVKEKYEELTEGWSLVI